jgi:hypothetical protein
MLHLTEGAVFPVMGECRRAVKQKRCAARLRNLPAGSVLKELISESVVQAYDNNFTVSFHILVRNGSDNRPRRVFFVSGVSSTMSPDIRLECG